jgi:hypothetical protein
MSNATLSATRGQISRTVDTGYFIQDTGSLAPFILGLVTGTIGGLIGVAALVVIFFV